MIMSNAIRKELQAEQDCPEELKSELRDELGRFEFTYIIAGRLLNTMYEKGFLKGMEDFDNSSPDYCYGNYEINTFPFGTKTDEVFPEYLGICCGKQKINDLFKDIKRQLDLMSKKLDNDMRKSVTVFTDKWDPSAFAKYEVLFLNAILNQNVNFNFYLVTDYGITKIPFMSRSRAENFRKKYAGMAITEDMPLKELVSKYKIYNMKYTVDQYDSFIPQYEQEHKQYGFNFENLTYWVDDRMGSLKTGRINEACAKNLIKAVLTLKDSGGVKADSGASSDTHRMLECDLFSFEWFDTCVEIDNPEFLDMTGALFDLIRTLD